MLTIDALKSLATALGCTSATGETVDAVIKYIADNYTAPVPNVPNAPATAGNYQLTVDDEGDLSWTSVTTYDVPSVPDTPTTAGTYNVVVDAEGVATWTAVVTPVE